MNTSPPTTPPIITNQFFREGIWAAVRDNYDHSSHGIGPFPTHEAACEYCEAYNRNEVLELWTRLSREQIAEQFCDTVYQRYTPTLRAFTEGHAPDAFIETLLYHTIEMTRSTWQPLSRDLALVLFSWSESDVNPDAVAEKYGAKYEYQWRNIQSEQRKNRIRCWCDDLRNDCIPSEIGADEPYLDWLDGSVRLFIDDTSPNGAEWRECKCVCCGSEVWQLFLEEGRYNDWFWWYAVPSPSDILRRSEGSLHKDNIEAWFEGRAGIYSFYEPRFYASTKIRGI